MIDWKDTKEISSLDIPELNLSDLADPWAIDAETTGSEVDKAKRLAGDRHHFRTPSARTFIDVRARPEAIRSLDRLPDEGEDLHHVMGGQYALWDLVAGLLDRVRPQHFDELWISTLSFSKQNAAEIIELFDAGRIKSIRLLISHYFKATSRAEYELLIPPLMARPNCFVAARRTHAKIVLVKTSDGTPYVFTSSANLRSSVNVEASVITRDQALFDFHAKWITQMMA